MPDTRSEADKLAGLIPVVWGSDDPSKGRVVRLRTLKRRKAAAWRSDSVGRLMGLVGGDLARLDDLARSLDGFSDLALDALLAYDQDGVLGSREWIDDHCDDSVIYDALKAVLTVVFPFVSDLRGAIKELGSLLALRDAGQPSQPSSTNGASPTGDLIPIS